MRKANRKNSGRMIEKRLAEARLSERERERAAHALHSAEAIVEAIVWTKEKIASLGAGLLKPGFKN
ncbi:MAG TPA: hypothetical protein VKF40_14805 [Burkholderiales bacterium]|nr:hypothetical protein [Burkholderiales bacterium]